MTTSPGWSGILITLAVLNTFATVEPCKSAEHWPRVIAGPSRQAFEADDIAWPGAGGGWPDDVRGAAGTESPGVEDLRALLDRVRRGLRGAAHCAEGGGGGDGALAPGGLARVVVIVEGARGAREAARSYGQSGSCATSEDEARCVTRHWVVCPEESAGSCNRECQWTALRLKLLLSCGRQFKKIGRWPELPRKRAPQRPGLERHSARASTPGVCKHCTLTFTHTHINTDPLIHTYTTQITADDAWTYRPYLKYENHRSIF